MRLQGRLQRGYVHVDTTPCSSLKTATDEVIYIVAVKLLSSEQAMNFSGKKILDLYIPAALTIVHSGLMQCMNQSRDALQVRVSNWQRSIEQ